MIVLSGRRIATDELDRWDVVACARENIRPLREHIHDRIDAPAPPCGLDCLRSHVTHHLRALERCVAHQYAERIAVALFKILLGVIGSPETARPQNNDSGAIGH